MHPTQLQRRQLLKGMGAVSALGAVGALTAFPFSKASAAAPKMAVFLPRSSRHPTLSAEYLAGLRVGMAQTGVSSDALTPIEYGAAPGVAIRQAQMLLGQEKLDVLTGVLCPSAALDLEPALRNTGTPLLVNDTGANRMPRVAQSGLIIRHSLEYWQSCAAFGHWAAIHLGKRAVLALGTLEVGYDFPKAFSEAFVTNGGQTVSTHISNLPHEQAEFSGLAQTIQEQQPDFVYALYSGAQANRFLDFYRTSGAAGKVLLAGGGFMMGTDSGRSLRPDLSIASWHAAQQSCTQFSSACDATGLPVTPFSILGYESGMRIAQAWAASNRQADAFSHLLHAQAATGPRARRRYEVATMESHGAHWIARSGSMRQELIKVSAANPWLDLALNQLQIQPAQNGWTNPYLVT